jgi:hypothetical protein
MDYVWPGIIAAQAIHVAAKLRIADLLASGSKTITELASESGAHPPTLERLLRALSTLEMFAPASDGCFRNTSLSEMLRSDHPQSQRDGALFLPARFLWLPIGSSSSQSAPAACLPRIGQLLRVPRSPSG